MEYRRKLAILVVCMLIMPSLGMVRRVMGDDATVQPFSWQMYTETVWAQDP